jgi:hypothetical protein
MSYEEMILSAMVADILAHPASEMVKAHRVAVKNVMEITGATKEQALEYVASELDVAYEAYNDLFDVWDEHPDWTEEQVKAETIRRKLG